MMEPNQVAAGQVPDENEIERLFPKCPPKQAAAGKRPINSNNKQPRRQNKSKVHQHSRRELEARRNKLNANRKDNINMNNNNNNFNNNNNTTSTGSNINANSTESSDDNQGTVRSRLKRSNSSGQYNNNNNNNSTDLQQQKSVSLATSQGGPRRSGKYTASQSLLQQLERSQSTYSNNINAASSQEQQPAECSSTVRIQEQPSSRVSGIIKSSSSFAFVNEQPAPQNQQACIVEPRKPSKQIGFAMADQAAVGAPINDGTAKYDNSYSDLLDNQEPPAAVAYKPACRSILRGSSLRKENSQEQQKLRETTINNLTSSPNEPPAMDSLLSKIDKRNSRSRSVEFNLQDGNSDKHTNLLVDSSDTDPCAPPSNANSVPPSHQAASLSTADADFRNNNNNNNNKFHRTTDSNRNGAVVDELISISPQKASLLINTTTPADNNHKFVSNDNSRRGDILRDSEDLGAGPKEDEKYINLFVYDSATNQTLQRTQIPTSPTSLGRQQQSALVDVAEANNNSFKENRYRDASEQENDAKLLNKVSDELAYNFEETTTAEVDINREEPLDSISIVQSNSTSSQVAQADDRTEVSIAEGKCIIRQTTSHQQLQPSVDNDTSCNIVSVQHRESQQLLTTDLNDQDGVDLVRNDASTEELCSIDDSLEDSVKNSCNIGRQDSTDLTPPPSSQTSSISQNNNNRPPTSHRSSLPTVLGSLQTVDESLEIEEQDNSRINPVDKILLLEQPTNEAMPANGPTRRAFVPPGHPQRIRPEPIDSPTSTSHTTSGGSLSSAVQDGRDAKQCSSNAAENPVKMYLHVMTGGVETVADQNIGKYSNASAKSTNNNGPRVKFSEENLVSVRDERDVVTLENFAQNRQHHNLSALLPSSPSSKQPPELSNSHALQTTNYQSGNETVKRQQTIDDLPERDLSVGLNKISIANATYGDEEANLRSDSKAFKNNSPPLIYPQSQPPADQNQAVTIEQPQSQGLIMEPVVQNLQHHKLPNETSHYSIVRSTSTNLANDTTNLPTRSASIQFNTLSDGESGPDEPSGGTPTAMLSSSNRRITSYRLVTKKCDPNSMVASGGVYGADGISSGRNLSIIPGQSPTKRGNACNLNDDDLLPTTKTALIFPRLDEGLSSEAESAEDDVEDEDERAVDADVDADDDDDDDDDEVGGVYGEDVVEDDNDDEEDDDDDDDDDMDDDDNLPQRGRGSRPVGQAGNRFLRPHQQQPHSQMKPSNRMISSLQQQAHNSSLTSLTQVDQPNAINLAKGPGLAYGGYQVNQDPLEHNDLKSMTNYSNQNGQPSNYWMDTSSQQQANLSPQATSSQQFSQRNHNNNNNLNNSISKQSNNNSFNSRDEAKVTNRLSSDTDNETDRLLGSQRSDQLKSLVNNDNINSNNSSSNNTSDLQPSGSAMKQQNTSSKEVLIEGVLFNVKYLGSTHSDCEGRSEKEDRIHQAEMAVQEVKFRNGESQSAVEVQLFISTEKIIVLEDKQRQIMMDHSLRTISYIADIGDAIVLIVRKKNNSQEANETGRPVSRISCHVFESRESHTITKAISHAFQVAYAELLKANNGVGETINHMLKDGLEYQEVLNSQEMSTDELEMFARKENQREVVVPKEEGEILGLSIVESGWGSVLPTVVIANMKQSGPAYRCKRLSIGDQILSVNGISLVGLPLAECQEILRKTKKQRVARLSVVPCPITVEVKIKRPDIKYQLGFSVQNGVICSLLRGGIAERGGVRVGHRIMSINGTTVVGVPHDKIVNLLANSVGEIRMKTCLTSLYRLILGQENPVHF